MFTYSHNKLKYYFLIVMVCLLQACADNHKKTEAAAPISDDKHINLRTLVVDHSPLLQGQIVSINENMKMSDLPELDGAFIEPLEKLGVIVPDEDCGYHLYYYGYVALAHNYTGAILGYIYCSGAGEERLILAVLDDNGNMLSALTGANKTSPAECDEMSSTLWEATKFTATYLSKCAITQGPDLDKTSVDSVTTIYRLNPDGKFEQISTDTANSVR